MTTLGFLAAVVVAVIGLLAGVLARRETKAQRRRAEEAASSQKESTAVNILTSLADTLREELDRSTAAAARHLEEERKANELVKTEYADLQVRYRVVVEESKAAQQTAGRLAMRVESLEDLCRRNGLIIPAEPGTAA